MNKLITLSAKLNGIQDKVLQKTPEKDKDAENGPKEKKKAKVDAAKRHVKFNENVEMHEISEVASSVNGVVSTRTWSDSKKQRENFMKG